MADDSRIVSVGYSCDSTKVGSRLFGLRAMKEFAGFLAADQLAIDISPDNAWGEWWNWKVVEDEKAEKEAARKGSLSRKLQSSSSGSGPDLITL